MKSKSAKEEAKVIFPIGIILDGYNKVSDDTCRMIQSDITKALEAREKKGRELQERG